MAVPAKGVIFDLFHTLTGLESEWSDLPVTSDFFGIDRRAWDRALHENSRRLTGEQSDPFLILRELAHGIDPSIAEEKIREAVAIRLQRFRHSLQKIPQANVDALKRLREAGLRLGLISNADKMEVASWADCVLCGLFDVELFSCDVGLAKPDPAIYRKCLEGLALPAGDCLFVGDGGSNELVGAREVGLRTVLMSGVIAELWPERIPARIEIADHHIKSLPEILSLLSLAAGSFELRKATSRDADLIYRVVAATMRGYVEQTWGKFNVEDNRKTAAERAAAGTVEIIRCGDADVGVLCVERHSTHVQLEQLFILPSHQKRGIGTSLVRRIAAEARAAKKPLRLRVLAVNPARKLYEREGFRVTSTTPERVYMEWHA